MLNYVSHNDWVLVDRSQVMLRHALSSIVNDKTLISTIVHADVHSEFLFTYVYRLRLETLLSKICCHRHDALSKRLLAIYVILDMLAASTPVDPD